MTVGTFRRSGLSLAVHGTGFGRKMVFQHGLCGDAAQSAEVFPGGTDWHAVTMECRGHGASDAGPPEDLSIATFADDLIAWLAAEGHGPVVLGGISMGAAIAQRIAVTRPDLVSALVLARPAWVTEHAPANMRANALAGDLLARHDPETALALFDESPTARRLAIEAPDNLLSLRGFFHREPAAVTSALLTRIPADGPGVTAADLAALRIPVLVVGHGLDEVHPVGLARVLATLIPGARLVEITPKAQDREAYRHDFREALHSFLKEIPE